MLENEEDQMLSCSKHAVTLFHVRVLERTNTELKTNSVTY